MIRTDSMRLGCALATALLLAACGGGGDASQPAASAAAVTQGDAARATPAAVIAAPAQRFLKPWVDRVAIYTEPTTLALFDPRGAGSATSLGEVTAYGWGVFDTAIPRPGGARELAGAARLFYLRPAVANQPAGIWRVKLGFDESHAPEFLFAACARGTVTSHATEPDGRRGIVSFVAPDCTTGVAYLVDDGSSTLLPGGAIPELQVLANPFTGRSEKLFYARTLADGSRALRVADADGRNEQPIASPDGDYAFGVPDQMRRALYDTGAGQLHALTWDAVGATDTPLATPPTGAPASTGWTSDAIGGWFLDSGGKLYRAQGSAPPALHATLPEPALDWGRDGAWNSFGHVLGLASIPSSTSVFGQVSVLYSVGKWSGAVHRLDPAGWNGESRVIGVQGDRVLLARSNLDLPEPRTSLVAMQANGSGSRTIATGVDVVGVLTAPVWHLGEPRQSLLGGGGKAAYITQTTSIVYCKPAAGAANCFEQGGTLYEYRFDLMNAHYYWLGTVAPYSRRGFPTLGFRIRDGHSNGRYLIEAGEIYGPFPMRLYSARPQTVGSLVEVVAR